MNMRPSHIITVFLAICLGLSSFTLKWTFDANADMKVLNNKVDTIVSSHERADAQDKLIANDERQIKYLWQYSKWLEGENAELRFKLNLPPESVKFTD